jgi:hypothetical protein
MKIVRHADIIVHTVHQLSFDYRGEYAHGFTFPCNEYGNVLLDELGPAALNNLDKCLAGEHDVGEPYVETFEMAHREPAVGLCNHCNREVVLSGFTNTCECGLDYNSAGQQLAPRCQWGEETGESLADILSVDNMGDLGPNW